MPLHRLSLLAVALGASSVLCACAGLSSQPEWRRAKVVQVVEGASAIAVQADSRCLVRAAAKDGDAHPAVVIVRYRVTRSYYTQAFLLPKDMTLAVGDALYVRTDECTLSRAAVIDKPASQPSTL